MIQVDLLIVCSDAFLTVAGVRSIFDEEALLAGDAMLLHSTKKFSRFSRKHWSDYHLDATLERWLELVA